jgi:hypothetical protein
LFFPLGSFSLRLRSLRSARGLDLLRTTLAVAARPARALAAAAAALGCLRALLSTALLRTPAALACRFLHSRRRALLRAAFGPILLLPTLLAALPLAAFP